MNAITGAEQEIAAAIQRAADRRELSEAEFRSIVESVLEQNPDFEHLTSADLRKISEEFGGLSEMEIRANALALRDLYSAKIRFEIMIAISKPTAMNASISPVPDGVRFNYLPNPAEAKLIGEKPMLASCVWSAKTDAERANLDYGLSKDGMRGNAIQHSMWNVLIAKYCGWYFSKIADAEYWAKRITDAHETGVRQDLNAMNPQMDFHNNRQGRRLFVEHAWTEWNQKEKRTEVKARDFPFFTDRLRKMADDAVRFTAPNQLPSYSYNLVFYNQEPRVGIHRLYNSAIPDHLFTRTAGEGAQAGWRTEMNNNFFVSTWTSASYSTLYRCWVGGRHYLSLDLGCEANVRAEGVLGQIAKTQQRYTVPLYRLRHPKSRDWLVTWSVAERDNAVRQWGYQSLGIIGYVWTAATSER
jgi:hypothetical protein